MQSIFSRLLATGLLAMLLPTLAQAHFTWLSSDDEGRALLFFGETPDQMDYKLPAPLAKAKVQYQAIGGEPQDLAIAKVEEDDFIGLRSEPKAVDTGVLTSHCTYGNYHGTLLTYYVKHYAGDLAQAAPAENKAAPEGFAIDARPSLIDRGVALTVTRDGKPVEGAGVTLIDPSGETADKETGKDGVVKFYNIAAGKIGFIVAVTEDAEGEAAGKEYTSISHYLTLTTNIDGAKTSDASASGSEKDDEEKAAAEKADAAEKAAAAAPPVPSALTPLPQGVASFGAAVADGYVYVYSGHIGPAHSHSKEHYSQNFYRLPLEGGEWQELPMEGPLQGLALVPYEGKVYRVGGMHSRNSEEEDTDMNSVDTFSVFDPETNKWTSLPKLPEARSSHDAVVVDGVLYVVGGWTLAGTEDGEWLETAWKIDLNNLDAGWQSITEPPFLRRALAAGYAGNSLVVIGGIDEAGEISREADALDLETGEWSKLPELPGDGMQGFGVSAWNHEGKLYVSGSSGAVLTLSDDMKEWQEVAQHADKRFFHRLLPAGENRLLMIGGASLKRRSNAPDSEWVELGAN